MFHHPIKGESEEEASSVVRFYIISLGVVIDPFNAMSLTETYLLDHSWSLYAYYLGDT